MTSPVTTTHSYEIPLGQVLRDAGLGVNPGDYTGADPEHGVHIAEVSYAACSGQEFDTVKVEIHVTRSGADRG